MNISSFCNKILSFSIFFPIHVDGLWSWQCKTIYVQQSFFSFLHSLVHSVFATIGYFIPAGALHSLSLNYNFSLSLSLSLSLSPSPSPSSLPFTFAHQNEEKQHISLSHSHLTHLTLLLSFFSLPNIEKSQ